MKRPIIQISLLSASFLLTNSLAAEEKAKVTYADHVLPILENKCVNCHNADEAKGGLDLSTYSATLSGGSGGDVVASEDPGSSRLFTLSAHTEEPFMPPRGTRANEKELKILSDWIAGGLLETSSSRARKSDKPKVDLNSISSTGKPDGPPAMPEHLILEPEVVTERPNAVPAIAHSPWAPIVAVAGQKQVLLFHSEDHDLLGVLPYPEGFPQTLSFSPNGAYLSCGGGRAGKSGNVVAWDIKTGERIIEVGKEYDIVLGADVSPDLKGAILGGPKRNIKMWDTVAGEEVNSIKKHPDWLLTAAYSPDGVIFATGGRNGGLYVWEAATGYEFYTLKGHTSAVTDIAWRSDGNLLASTSEDGQIILWEMLEGKQVKKWNAHPGGALAVTFSPDGRIASVGRDKKVKIWQADGKELRSINASDDIVLSVAFSHDNKRVFTGDWHGAIKVWDVENGAELATIEPNPPSIEEQLAYSEKRIRELTGELPKLEQGVQAVSKELADARNSMTTVDKKLADATKARDGLKGQVAQLDGKIKALTPQLEQATKTLNDLRAKTKAATDAVNAANGAFAGSQGNFTKAQAHLKSRSDALAAVTNALNAAKGEAAKPALDAEKQKQHDQLAGARNQAAEQKKAADAAAAKAIADRDGVTKQLNEAKASLANASGQIEPLKKSVANADGLLKAATAERTKADAALVEASKEGKIPPMELVDAQASAAEKERQATTELNRAKGSLTAAENNRNKANGAINDLSGKLAGLNTSVQQQGANQKAKADLLAKAEAAYKPLKDAIAAGQDRKNKANALVAAKTTEFQAADKAQKEAKAAHDAAQKAMTEAGNKLNSLKQNLANAQAGEKKGVEAYNAKKAELDEAKAQLAAAQGNAKKAEETVVAVTKEKEGAKAKVDAVVKKEADTKKSIEVAKAELEDSKFLVKKWQAAAINLTAKHESEELDDMEVDLEDMKEDEVEAKTEVAEATKSREEAEQTLAVARKTVNEGEQKLAEKSSTVLERALQLVSNRAIAELKVDAGLVQDDTPPVELAAIFNEENPEELIQVGDMPEEIEEEQVIETVAAEALAYKSREEITEEVETLRKRLSEIEGFLATTYSAADETKATVDQASKVARETPKVIEERAKLEKEAAEELAEAEEERKRQESALAEQKKKIEELRKKYIATLPERD
ncbi:MAG: c-type cytochrome domain-containing protein [Verrucomicrobiota bacterium]